MDSHRLALYFHSWLLILIFTTTLASASNSFVGPRLSVRPPKWLVRRGGDESSTPSTNLTDYFQHFTLHEYNQTIDHFTFRPESYLKFKQRVVINTMYWGGSKSNSPIFVYLGAEESIDDEVNAIGLLYENAQKFKAMIVFIEHRFYGESIPYGWKIEEAIKHFEIRGCLSTSQVLADYAEVISSLKQKFSADLSPVVVFGGSYGGMLATWFRLKYPHIAMGALASSAPVLDHIGSPNKYYDRVAKDFWDTSKSCYMTIKQSFDEIARVASQPNGLAKLSKRFKFCSTLKNVSAINLLIRGTLKNAAQYDNPPDYQVAKTCKAIEGVKKDAYILDKLWAGLDVLSGISNATGCLDPKDLDKDEGDLISYSWEVSWMHASEEASKPPPDPSSVQSCMELVHDGGVSKNSLFPPLKFSKVGYAKDCARKYRVPSRAPYWLNQNYGGKHIKLDLRRFGSNIIFTNGIRDPWSPSGVLEDLSDTLVALVHPGAHCVDVQFSAKTDPKWLTELRKKEMSIIQGWLSTYYADLRALNMA